MFVSLHSYCIRLKPSSTSVADLSIRTHGFFIGWVLMYYQGDRHEFLDILKPFMILGLEYYTFCAYTVFYDRHEKYWSHKACQNNAQARG